MTPGIPRNAQHFNASDISKYEEFDEFDGSDELEELADRTLFDKEYRSECRSTDRTITPSKLKNIQNIERTMLMSSGQYTQAITIRECQYVHYVKKLINFR